MEVAATLRAAIAAARRGVRTVIPAIVTRYDSVTRCADVTIGLVDEVADGTPCAPLPVPAIRVAWPRFAGIRIEGRLNPGDEVLLVVCSRAIDGFLASGAPAPIGSDRMFELVDSWAIPAALSDVVPPVSSAPAEVALAREDGQSSIRMAIDGAGAVTIEAASIRLGEGATPGVDAVAVARLVRDYLASCFASGVPVPNDGGAALQTAWQLFVATNPATAMAAAKAAAEV